MLRKVLKESRWTTYYIMHDIKKYEEVRVAEKSRPLPPLLLFDMLPTHYFLCYLQQASPDSWKSHILEQLLSFFSITTPHGLVATGVLCFRQVSVDG
ncbi:hypothetical protein CK203_024057 [Vitis vinifera]|uniref:Uncharacterized protein n=1 Tax=Vitis vinifera TaxID=29760 RepID=A0A438IQ19_VITVI|nr:hypothetical protein CK203_085990 [Vitis vinifera]RVW98814.1 hypothetical protein CK203_024057 [Vitis vinifera]